LVGIYLIILSNYFIFNKNFEKRNWGERRHFLPNFSTFKFFFEALIANHDWLNLFKYFFIIILSLVFFLKNEMGGGECWHFLPNFSTLKK
jgi:hypothetical protein